jgi:hypothetical protein
MILGIDPAAVNAGGLIIFLVLSPLLVLKLLMNAYGSERSMMWSRRLNLIVLVLTAAFFVVLAMRVLNYVAQLPG